MSLIIQEVVWVVLFSLLRIVDIFALLPYMVNCALNHSILSYVEAELLVPLKFSDSGLIEFDALLDLRGAVLVQTRANRWRILVSTWDHANVFYFVGRRSCVSTFFALYFIRDFHYAGWFLFFFCLVLSWSLLNINGTLVDLDQLIIYLLYIDVVDLHIVFYSGLDEAALCAGLGTRSMVAQRWLGVVHDLLRRGFGLDDALGGALGCKLLYFLLVQSEWAVHLGVSLRSHVGCCFLISKEHQAWGCVLRCLGVSLDSWTRSNLGKCSSHSILRCWRRESILLGSVCLWQVLVRSLSACSRVHVVILSPIRDACSIIFLLLHCSLCFQREGSSSSTKSTCTSSCSVT